MILLAGCATSKTIIVNPNDDILQLAAPVRAKVRVTDDGRVWKDAGKITLPEGWYVTPGPPR